MKPFTSDIRGCLGRVPDKDGKGSKIGNFLNNSGLPIFANYIQGKRLQKLLFQGFTLSSIANIDRLNCHSLVKGDVDVMLPST